jgi:acyl-CoA ligase (AMP-forming) (exosortase A-associated)
MRDSARIEGELLRWAAAAPAVPALVDGDRYLDYATLARWASRFARELGRNGVQPGDRVAIYLDHTAEQVAALYATWIAGAIAVPVNASLNTHQVAHILSHSGAGVLVTDRRKWSQLDEDTLAGIFVVGVTRLEGCSECAPAAEVALDLAGGDTPAAILYTSGSTGRPKGILISHANLLAGARIVAGYLGIREDERILSVLPFSFDYGLNQLLSAVHRGCTLVLQRSHFPPDLLRALERQRITALAGVPPLWIQLMERTSALQSVALPHLRYITNSGGSFPTQLVRRYRELWPHVRMFLMYGLSEAFRSTYLPPEELDARPDSIGRPIPETDVLVVGLDDRICADGEPGELVHRGPTVALGYWNDAEATARVFRPDPERPSSGRAVVYSGDVVRRDEHGFLYFVGRRDQLIKSYGYRVSPDEVEELIFASKLVAEVAVHGRPDAVAGAAIVAHVIPADPAAFELRRLLDFCRERMPPYMVPKAIEIHDELPRTASGKLDRKALTG